MVNKASSNPYSIEIDRGNRILKLLKHGAIIREYPIAVKTPLSPYINGKWIILKKTFSGKYEKEYFMKLSIPYGVHGIYSTTKPLYIKKLSSNKSIKMYFHQAKELYNTVPVGTVVNIY
ncbi:MAG: L,D-transpeptidase [Clostridium sp.]|nr:L,D-transpeptidase [Clostridium sp.]